ncbi:MAG: hypothetical protein BWY71_00097 [Planctomycetes bacterium ADurb.Bin412]|nr:MAG: hypothetical protein BWY71_00097 [Planctomycetes bacterium ADurb.Bin412]
MTIPGNDYFSYFQQQIKSSDTKQIIQPRSIRLQRKLHYKNSLQLKRLEEVLPDLPAAGESLHLISDGSYDFWRFVPYLVSRLGPADECSGSTWTMSRSNIHELLDLYDRQKIRRVALLIGLDFKHRKPDIWENLERELIRRGQRLKSLAIHAKIILLQAGEQYLTLEGSANFTGNPRIEQFVITNSQPLYEFHSGWMETIFHDQ